MTPEQVDPAGARRDGPDPDEIAKRAMELSARAEELARHAHETAGIDEQLARLEAELDALDAEEASLYEDDGAAETASERPAGDSGDYAWADQLTERVGNLGDRIGALVEQVTEAAMQRVEVALAGDAPDSVDEQQTVDVPTGAQVRIDSFGGSVHVQGHADAVLSVVARGRRLPDQDALVDVDVRDGVVQLTVRGPRRWRGRGVRLDVQVPAGTDLTISTGGGNVQVDGVGGAVDIRTGGGSIRLGDARRQARLTTGGGSIDVTGLEGTVTARTGGGSIAVTGLLSGSCSLRSGGGNITVRPADGTNLRVDARGTGSHSDVPTVHAHRGRLAGQIGDGSGGELDAKTGGGSVRLVV